MKKFLLILLGIVTLNLCAFAIESDFKNSLLKVDYVKTGTDSYAIRLFTQKPYSEPIKVIKKTNTNYYILLPETFHSVGTVAPTGDIKSTEVKLFPYAGQDLNNGYTKISIFTSKPLNIKAQLNSSSGAVAPSVDPKKLSQLDSAFSTKQAQINEAQRQAQYEAQQKQLAAQKEAQRQAQIKAQQAREAAQKAEEQRQAQIKAQQEAQIKAQQEAQARAQAQKEAQLRAQQEAKAKAQQEAQRQAQIKAQQEAQARAQAQREAQARAQQEAQRQAQTSNNLQVLDTAATKYQEGAQNEKKSDTEFTDKTPNIAENELNEENIITQDIINNPEINQTMAQIPETQNATDNYANIKERIKDKIKPYLSHLRPYYYIIKDNSILLGALAVAFIGILMLIAISKSKKKRTTAKMETQQTSQNDNIEDKNYDTTNNIETSTQEQQETTQDDVQAFKDEFMELAFDEKAKEESVETIEEEYIEPEVLSSAEIAPNRGFMVVDTQGTKALFGYIYDNVFLLYQFKEFISDSNIKFRISEKQDDRTFFIVKVDKFKLLVKVTNSSMKLELEM